MHTNLFSKPFFSKQTTQNPIINRFIAACLLISLLGSHSSNAIQTQTNLVNKKQAAQYINQVIDSLFSSREIAYNQDLEQFKRSTRDSLLNTLGFYPSFHALSQVYNSRDLREGILGQATVFIEQKTRLYAQEHVKQIELPQNLIDRVLVRTIVDRVRDQLAQKLSNTQDQTGILSNYIGIRLKERVNKLIHDEIRKPVAAPRAPVAQKRVVAPVQATLKKEVEDLDDADSFDAIETAYEQAPKRRRYVPAPVVQTEFVQPVVPVMQPQPYVPYAPYGYAVDVVDVYEPAYVTVPEYGYLYDPCYAPVYGCVPGLSIGAGLPLGNGDGFLGFQLNL